MVATALVSSAGHCPGSPSGVVTQSIASIRRPISPPRSKAVRNGSGRAPSEPAPIPTSAHSFDRVNSTGKF
jgi:hypothetical protein